MGVVFFWGGGDVENTGSVSENFVALWEFYLCDTDANQDNCTPDC